MNQDCPDCEARAKMMREALFQAKLAAAVKHAAVGAAELVGAKQKTGAAESKKLLKSRRLEIPALPVSVSDEDKNFAQEQKS